MSAKDRLEQARRRVKDLQCMTDPQLAEAYVTTVMAPANIHYSPYLITAIRDAGLWDRLDSAVIRRNRKP